MSPALEVTGVSKSYFGVPVLADVTLSLGAGRILGLVGQNGAGKSTLMNIIGGVVAPEAGTMTLEGAPYAPADPRAAERRGVGFIHQELNLFPNLSIAENIFIGAMPRTRTGLIDRRTLHRRAVDLLLQVDLDLPPDIPVERLSPGERQLVEVTKVLQLDARIIIFDEPTTSLTPRETTRLFALIDRLKAAGKTIVYITHILADVVALADDVAVLRDGRLVEAGPVGAFTVDRMINLMLGRPIDQLYPPRVAQALGNELLEARGLSQRGTLENISFSIRQGEIVGLFGLMGSGRTELARLLFGLERPHSGSLTIGGQAVSGMTPRQAICTGIAFVTENRREEGLMMKVPIAEDIALASLDTVGGALGLIDQTRLVSSAAEFAAALQIKSGPIDRQPAKSLSGGNQQKVVVAKWLMTRPVVFLLDEPTRGIDVAAKFEIYSIVRKLAANGCGLLFISSEIEEVMAMSDRILVMSRGEIVGEFISAEFDREAILRAAFRQEAQAA